MGYEDCWAALNGEMPKRIPRTEYSVEMHYELVSQVTGLPYSEESSQEERTAAVQAFQKAWDFGFQWGVAIGRGQIQGRTTDMGHAEYAAGGTDRRDTVHCPFEEPEDVLAYDAREEAGPVDHKEWVGKFGKRYHSSMERYPDKVYSDGVYTTLFSGLIDIFGWEMLLMAAGTDPEGFGEVANRYAEWIQPFFDAFAESDAPVLMSHDDICWTSGPVLAPDWYRKYVFPHYKKFWQPSIDAGKRVVFTSDGTYTEFFDDIVEAGAHALVMEPTSDMALFAEKYGKTHGFIGNADTRILLSGTREEIRAEVERCVNIGRDCPGFIMAVGNHIPPNTPVENALYYNEVFEELRDRSV